jgi:hypothetical protein
LCSRGDHGAHSRIQTWSAELVEQRPGISEIGGVEALGEPAVDRREQVVRLGAPALLGPESGEAGRGAQLQGFRLLAARGVDRLLEPECRFDSVAGLRQDDPLSRSSSA